MKTKSDLTNHGFFSDLLRKIFPPRDSSPHNGAKNLNVVGQRIRAIRMEKHWTQNRLAKELQSAGLNKSRVAVARIESQMVHVYDFQLLYIAKVLGVAPLDLFPKIQANGNLHEEVTWLKKLRRACASIARRYTTNRGSESSLR
ncbi:MAG TPA: helix-turn-helix transcriptional regulator [Verrucomicrobiae bacterium]|nr:helix-turn-helix transcriptional regulator [Verrucomicrobiae bacterium]